MKSYKERDDAKFAIFIICFIARWLFRLMKCFIKKQQKKETPQERFLKRRFYIKVPIGGRHYYDQNRNKKEVKKSLFTAPPNCCRYARK